MQKKEYSIIKKDPNGKAIVYKDEETGTFIPADPGNRDYQDLLRLIEDGQAKIKNESKNQLRS